MVFFHVRVYEVHPAINQTAHTDARKNTVILHVQVFLRMNTWLLEACRGQHKLIKWLMKKVYSWFFYIHVTVLRNKSLCNITN
jgi:hypothetical protein